MNDEVLKYLSTIKYELNKEIDLKLSPTENFRWNSKNIQRPFNYEICIGDMISEKYKLHLRVFGKNHYLFSVLKDGRTVVSVGRDKMRIDSELSREEVKDFCRKLESKFIMRDYAYENCY